MARESGQNGLVKIVTTNVALVYFWDLEVRYVISKRATSDSAGWKVATKGVGDASGTIRCLQNTAAALTIIHGTAATLLLYVNATEFWSIPAIISRDKVSTDIDDGKDIEFECTFESNGAITEPTWA